MDALIGTFHIDWKLILAQVVNFAIVFFVLYRFAIKPISKMMDERKQTIEKGITDAQTNQSLLEETKAMYDLELSRAREDAHQFMLDMKAQVEAKRKEMIEKAEEEVEHFLSAGKKSLDEEKQKILKEAERELASIVIKATERVVGETVKDKVASDLVAKSIEQIK